jgi:Ca-activated chloride channel homolog
MNNVNTTYQIKKIARWMILSELLSVSLCLIMYFVLSVHSNEENQLTFKESNYLFLLFGIPLIHLIYLLQARNRNKVIEGFSATLRKSIFKPVSSTLYFWKFFFIRQLFFFLIISLSFPFFGEKKLKVSTNNMELVIALDISNSMNSRDIDRNTSRLEISKRAIIQLINSLKGEKVGISVFAGNAYVQLPITSDYNAAKMFVNDIESSMLSLQGTNIQAALKTSLGMYSKKKVNKGLILVTDGENHETFPIDELDELRSSDIHLCVVGIGTKKGGLVPINPNRMEFGYKADEYGSPILSKVNKELLNHLAKEGEGYLMLTEEAFPDLTQLLTHINTIKRTHTGEIALFVKKSLYPWTLAIALVSWILFNLVGKIRLKI